jgi:hypothetical protein
MQVIFALNWKIFVLLLCEIFKQFQYIKYYRCTLLSKINCVLPASLHELQ